jgi:hypothetical protein
LPGTASLVVFRFLLGTEIDEALLRHPAILEAASVGIADAQAS